MVPGMFHFTQSHGLALVRESSVFPASKSNMSAILKFIEHLQKFQKNHK